jgi:hypothetical protein
MFEFMRFDDDGDPIVKDGNGIPWLCWLCGNVHPVWKMFMVDEWTNLAPNPAIDVPPEWIPSLRILCLSANKSGD